MQVLNGQGHAKKELRQAILHVCKLLKSLFPMDVGRRERSREIELLSQRTLCHGVKKEGPNSFTAATKTDVIISSGDPKSRPSNLLLERLSYRCSTLVAILMLSKTETFINI
jgi:hypothetical protein